MVKVPKSRKKATKRKEAGKKKRQVNIDAWLDKYIMDFVAITGLDMLGLRSKEEYLELLGDILIQLYGSLTSYTNVKTLAKRYARNKKLLDSVIAERLASYLDTFTEEQAEFIVYNIGDSVLNLAPKIYPILRKLERDDLVRVLRSKWANAWLRRRTPVLPPACPRCGFNSVMPDMTCAVCGNTLSEEELKHFMKFREELTSVLQVLTCVELSKLLNHETVLINGSGIKLPWDAKSPVDVEVFLTKEEKKLIKDELMRRCDKQHEGDKESKGSEA
ncbi:MAG: hypothetical protein J7L55_03065 [Desulfurococcales archaeon]|nr:hypothetical protein [Desulfurococcales archaeon]